MNDKTNYRVPTVHPECEPVSLSQFDLDDIREYLRRESADFNEGPESCDGLYLESDFLDRLETLALCGQLQIAVNELLDVVSQKIGRQL